LNAKGWYSPWPFGIYLGYWYILWAFGNFVAIWYISPCFGMLRQEKSGNLGAVS
jgi:hypothetical protein